MTLFLYAFKQLFLGSCIDGALRQICISHTIADVESLAFISSVDLLSVEITPKYY